MNYGVLNDAREESENGGEQEAAITLPPTPAPSPPLHLPEVSSAPSWLELSSFLLTFAAEADMFAQTGFTHRPLRGWLVALNVVSPRPRERLMIVKLSAEKATTCCRFPPHNVNVDGATAAERGSHSRRRSRAPFITNALRRMRQRPKSSASQNRSEFAAII